MTIKSDTSNCLKLGELNKYVKIWEEIGVTRKSINYILRLTSHDTYSICENTDI